MTHETPEAEKFEPTAAQKKLLRAVYIMGILLVLLFLGLIVGIIWKSTQPKPPASVDAQSLNLGINPADIKLMDIDGNILAITTASELIVIDVVKKKVLLREVAK
jgi:hypothetical protein